MTKITNVTALKAALPNFRKAPVPATVDSIIAPLKQQVYDLDTLIYQSYINEDNMFLERQALRDKIDVIEQEIAANEEQRVKARSVRDNIAAIIG